MATPYQNIHLTDLGAGLDTESSENQIKPGFMEDIQNADPKPGGQIQTRAGYQGYAGNIPVRITEVRQTSATKLCFVFDEDIDLSSIRSQPIVVRGRLSNNANAGNDFDSEADRVQYYAGFSLDVKVTFAKGTFTETVTSTTHDITTIPSIIWGIAAESTSVVNFSHSQFILDNFSVLKSNNDVNYTYTNNTIAAFDGFIAVKERALSTGSVFNSALMTIGTGTNTYNVPFGTHNLQNNNILVKVFEDTGIGGSYIERTPDSVVITESTGNVAITFTGVVTGFNAIFSLVSVPTSQFKSGNLGAAGTVDVTIDTTGNSPFIFAGCYLKDPATSVLEQVIPNSIVSDVGASQVTVSFTNDFSGGRIFYVLWDYITVRTNRLCVDPIAYINNITDLAPQMTLWGLNHADIYGSSRDRHEGWTSHLDSYRSLGENRLVAGLGGNLFSAQLIEEGTNATDYLMPTLYPSVNANLNASTTIGPAFYDTGDNPGRTRGYITGDDGGTNNFSISTIAYDSGNTWVKYTLSIPNIQVFGTLSSIIDTTLDSDRLRVSQCGWSINNGEFTIKAATLGVNSLDIWVENSGVTGSDFDEVDVGGFAGIFTDHLVFQGSTVPPFIPGDLLLSGLFDATNNFRVVYSFLVSGTTPTTVIDNCIETMAFPSTLRITAQRDSAVVPLRTFGNTASVINFVNGDMLYYSEIDRLLRINHVNTSVNRTISTITGYDIGSATYPIVTLTGFTTDNLVSGMKILIYGTTYFQGEFTIDEVLSGTEFSIISTLTTADTGGFVLGNTIEVDETLTYKDTETSDTTISVQGRWAPIEFPTDSYNLTPKTRVNYFDSNGYGNQPILRSGMVQDNMYLSNGDDEVLKFDGVSLYRAGLFRWQPGLFVTTDTTSTGKIAISNPATSFSAISGPRFTILPVDEGDLQVGDIIQTTTDSAFYTIKSITNDLATPPVASYIIVDRDITGGGTGTVNRISTFKYYFRLNAVDANDNIVASAVTGSDDTAIRLGVDAAVRIRLVGMPAWDIYDYDKLTVQIYRTKSNQVAPFYLLATKQMSFNATEGYLDYVDTAADDTIFQLDPVNTALKGAELGNAWTEPLRAKYVTSADNRLVLGNVTDYPQLDIQFDRLVNDIDFSMLLNSSYSKWLFRKDNTESGTLTDMTNRATYEFVSTVNGISSVTGNSPFTVNTSAAHGLATGDWVYLFHSTLAAGNNLRHSGWWRVSTVPGGSSFTVDASVELPLSGGTINVNSWCKATISTNIPVPLVTDYNYGALTGNEVASKIQIALRRLANAINSSMRISSTASGTFKPWMIAGAGSEFGQGHIVIRQPYAGTLNMEVVTPLMNGAPTGPLYAPTYLPSDNFAVYINSVRRSGASSGGVLTKRFPSRVLISYPNFPEIFDAPTALVDADSQSAIDVNSADGQEITAVIPFFGQSAFGGSQNDGVVLVFKTNSVYLISIPNKANGLPAVQKLETRGKGCTAPYSVSSTKAGIIFANETGIYRIGHDLKLDYVGRKYERQWKENINKTMLPYATATHDTETNTYKLSYPIGAGTPENSDVAVYNHTREEVSEGYGSWTTYNNHPAVGWTNLLANAYFASTTGRVFSTRKLGDKTDYRDDSSPIDMYILVGATDFGDAGRRKLVKYITTHFRAIADVVGATLETSLDLTTTFNATDAFRLEQLSSGTGLSNSGDSKILTIQSSVGAKKGVYIQLLYSNNTLDEPICIAGIDYTVLGLTERGITQAARTTK